MSRLPSKHVQGDSARCSRRWLFTKNIILKRPQSQLAAVEVSSTFTIATDDIEEGKRLPNMFYLTRTLSDVDRCTVR